MNQYKTSRSTNDALSLPDLKNGVSRAKAMKTILMFLLALVRTVLIVGLMLFG